MLLLLYNFWDIVYVKVKTAYILLLLLLLLLLLRVPSSLEGSETP